MKIISLKSFISLTTLFQLSAAMDGFQGHNIGRINNQNYNFFISDEHSLVKRELPTSAIIPISIITPIIVFILVAGCCLCFSCESEELVSSDAVQVPPVDGSDESTIIDSLSSSSDLSSTESFADYKTANSSSNSDGSTTEEFDSPYEIVKLV